MCSIQLLFLPTRDSQWLTNNAVLILCNSTYSVLGEQERKVSGKFFTAVVVCEAHNYNENPTDAFEPL